MKTPRDLLFSRHQAAAPKLDAIRRKVVEQHFAAPGRAEAATTGFLTRCWIELVRPYRPLWTGLAAVWVLLLIVNFSQRDTQIAGAKSPPTATMMMAFPDQEKMLRELLSDRSLPEEADRPRSFTPKPRSEVARAAAV